MICVTLQNKSLEEILAALDQTAPALEMAEIRLDRCPLDEEDIETLFSSSDTPLVATCRASSPEMPWQAAEKKLLAAIRAGAAYADLEIEAPPQVGKKIRRACSEYGVTMIRSCHYFEDIPARETLREAVRQCSRFGGEIVKVVGTARSEADCARILSLYEDARNHCFNTAPERLIAFAMGEPGRPSRIECLKQGAPFTYAALTEVEAAAPGQQTYSEMSQAVYGDRTFLGRSARLNMPASKSFAQRAILAATLAEGTSELRGYSPCGDSEAALSVAEALGAKVEIVSGSDHGKTLRITSSDRDGTPDQINVGESGLLTRLMIPIVAVHNKIPVRIDGCGTLLNRPLKDASEIMAHFGTLLRPASANGNPDELHVPLTVQGPLLPGRADFSGRNGSQLISGLLTALPLLPEDSILKIREPKSIPYMFITLDVLRKFGIHIGSEMEGDDEFLESQDWGHCTGITFRIQGGQRYRAASFDIEGDWSAAANFLVAGAVFGKARLEGLDTTSLQADISIMDILMEAGASLSQLEAEDGGHTGTITVQRAPLQAFDTDLGNCPDLFPIVSILAAFCSGRSHIQGFKRLAGKESDRGAAILNMLTQMGVNAFAEGDMMSITGEALAGRCLNGRLLRGGSYTSSRDHRMVMALQVASLGADGPIEIDDTACVAKSFPDFQRTFDTLATG
jgi:3-phosphoshikimate 1-carboxyvinyltransferase